MPGANVPINQYKNINKSNHGRNTTGRSTGRSTAKAKAATPTKTATVGLKKKVVLPKAKQSGAKKPSKAEIARSLKKAAILENLRRGRSRAGAGTSADILSTPFSFSDRERLGATANSYTGTEAARHRNGADFAALKRALVMLPSGATENSYTGTEAARHRNAEDLAKLNKAIEKTAMEAIKHQYAMDFGANTSKSASTFTNNGIKSQQNKKQQEANSALEKYMQKHLFAEGTRGGIKQQQNRTQADQYGRVESLQDLGEKSKLMGQAAWNGFTKGTLNSLIQASHYLDGVYRLFGGDEDASGNMHKQVYAATKRNNEANDVGNPLDDYQEWYKQDAAAFKEKTDAEGITAAADFAEGLGQSAAVLPTFAIPGLGEAVVYFQVAGDRYDEAIAEGATEGEAVLSASLDAFPSAVIERFGGGERIISMVTKGMAPKSIFKNLLSSAISEGIENTAQESVSSGTKSVYKDVPFYSNVEGEDAWINPQNWKKAFVTGALSGAILGGGTSVVSKGLNAAISRSSTQPLNDIETETRQNLSTGKITQERSEKLLRETDQAKAVYDVVQTDSIVKAQGKIDGYVSDGTFTKKQGYSLQEVVDTAAADSDTTVNGGLKLPTSTSELAQSGLRVDSPTTTVNGGVMLPTSTNELAQINKSVYNTNIEPNVNAGAQETLLDINALPYLTKTSRMDHGLTVDMAAAQGKDQDFGTSTQTESAAGTKGVAATSDEAMASLKEQAKGKRAGDTVSAAFMENGQVKVYTASVNESGIGLVSVRNATAAEKEVLQGNDGETHNRLDVEGTARIGTTGEGIPLEKIKPEVLKQIRVDENAAYGYLPIKGTAYDKSEYDFTDSTWAKKMRDIRINYLEASKQIDNDIVKMQLKGFSKEDIADHVVNMRNQQKVTSREDMTTAERIGLEERNIERYGNPIGPTAKGKFDQIKESNIDQGIHQSDEQIWEIIIQKSMEKDDVINTLLGINH